MKIVYFLLFATFFYQGQLRAQVEEVRVYTEKMASFPGGTTELYKFIYSHLEYPSEAKKWEVSGEVITQFVVDQNGDLRSIKVIKGLGYGLDEEAIRVIELMDKEHQWEPATLMGQPVPITYNLPIKFVL